MPTVLVRFVRLLMLFLLPLCAGAIWSVAIQALHRDLPWAALAMPAILVLMRGQLGFLNAPTRVLLHALAACAGIAFAQALITGVRVAAQFGYGPMETLDTMGAAMTWELIWLRSGAPDWIAAVLGIALSAAIGLGHRRHPPRATPRSGP
jgi:hypothetical protein